MVVKVEPKEIVPITVPVQEYALPGVMAYDIIVRPDERGFFAEALRLDWGNLVLQDKILQANISHSYPGMIRAWHRHNRGQIDYFIVLKGAMKICAYDEKSKQIVEIVASEKRLQVVRIPGFYWHGTKTVSSEPSLTVYLTTRTYDYKNPDEERIPWNAEFVIAKTGKPFDWNAPPHK